MRAGNLRHNVKFEQPTETRDAFGAVVDTWGTVPGLSSVPASFRSLRGDELFKAQTINNEARAEFRIRYQAGLTDQITEDMRIVFDGKTYQILSILPDMTARREFVINVSRGLQYVKPTGVT